MAMRFGEMVLVIRTQDYASRNLNRLSQNLGKLSKTQELQRRKATQLARQGDLLARKDTMTRDITNLRRRLDLEQRLYNVGRDRRKLARGLARTEAVTGATGQIRGARGFIGSAAPFIAEAKVGMQQLAGEEGRLRRQHASLLNEIRATSPALAKMGTAEAAARLRRLEGSLQGVSRRLKIAQSDLAITGAAINQLKWDNLHRFGQALSRAGRIMQLTGLVATGSFAAMANAAANFGQSATLAATQTRDIGAPIAQVATRSAKLQKFILDQMQKFPAAADDMSGAAYEIFSSLDLADKGRIKFWKGLQILEKTNRVAVAGGVDLSDAIQGLVITLNNFDPNLKNVNATLDTMFDIVRFGNLHVSDFTQMMTKVAPAAKGVGHELKDLGGSLAFLTRVMAPARVATGFSRLEDAFSNRDFIQGVKIVSRARLGKTLDIEKPGGGLIPFMDILENLTELFPELEQGKLTAQEFFKIITSAGREARIGRPSEGLQFTAEGRRAFTQLVQNMDQVRMLQALITGNQGEFNRAFAAMKDTPAIQWKIFLNTLKATAIEIGQDALPALLSLAAFVRRAIDWWRGLSDETRTLVTRIAVFSSVAALLGGILLSVVGGLISIVAAAALLTGGLGTAGGAGLLGRMAMLLGILRSLSLIGAILLTVKIIVDSQQLENLRTWIEENVPGGPALNKALGMSGMDIFNKITGRASEAQEAIKNFKPGERMFPGTKDLRTWGDMFPKLAKQYKENGDDIISWESISRNATKEVKDEMIKGLTDMGMSLDEVRKKFGDTGTDVEEMARRAAEASRLMEQKVDEAADGMMSIFTRMEEQNKAAMGSLFGGPAVTGIIGNVFTELNSQLRQFGIQIPMPFAVLRKDMQLQLMFFKRWRNSLNKLLARGAPLEFVQEIQEMGPEAGLPIAEGLLQGGKMGFKNLLKEWKRGQTLIHQATKSDFDRQLADWERHGKNIVLALIRGIISEPSQMALRDAFKTYVTDNFGNILQAEVTKEMQEAVAAGAAAASAAASSVTPGAGGAGNGPQGMTPQQLTSMLHKTTMMLTATQNARRSLQRWVVDPRSPGGQLIVPEEVQTQQRLARQARRLRRRQSITRQLLRQETRNPNAPTYTVTYGGDTITVRADGATPESVTRALEKYAFNKRHRNRNRR